MLLSFKKNNIIFVVSVRYQKKMTIIIGLKDTKNKKIILGADTQCTRGQEEIHGVNKIIEIPIDIVDGYGETIKTEILYIASCGWSFLESFLEYGFEPPTMNEQQKFIEYLYNNFLPDLRAILQEDNLIKIDNNVSDSSSAFIFVFQDTLYSISRRFAVDYITDKEYIINGSGSEIALGSIYTNLTFHKDMDYKDIVEQAIISSGENTIYCDATPNIKIIKY